MLALSAPSSARANGRFPRAERLIEDPRDPNHLILGATYGLITTSDRGRNWFYVCETAFSRIDPYVGDPIVDFGNDGTVVVDVQSGINVSSDNSCSWSPAFGGPGTYVADFTVGRASGSSTLAVYAASEDGSVSVHVVESTDGGRSFQAMGAPLPVGTAFTIDVAPSDANTIYVSALTKTNAPVLAVSKDGGATWTTTAITTGPNERPFIAAIGATDPRIIYVRTEATSNDTGVPSSNDALYVTTDGGATWREVFRAAAEILGFALSPDGGTVLVGYGDPMDPDVLVDPSVLGLYRASTADYMFTRLSTTSTTCLAWTKSGLYECTSQFETGYAVAFAPAAANGSTDVAQLAPLLDLATVKGPSCCAERDICLASWSTACVTFGACDAGAPLAGFDICQADAGPSGTDAAASNAKDAGIDASVGSEGGVVPSPASSSSGCSCRVGRGASSRFASLATMSTLLLWVARSRRRRSRLTQR